MPNIFLASVQLRSEAAVCLEGLRKVRVTKAFKNSSRAVHFLVRAQFTGRQC